jgi:hypothetical protein
MSCDPRRSLITHPDAISFLRILQERVFQQPRDITPVNLPKPSGCAKRMKVRPEKHFLLALLPAFACNARRFPPHFFGFETLEARFIGCPTGVTHVTDKTGHARVEKPCFMTTSLWGVEEPNFPGFGSSVCWHRSAVFFRPVPTRSRGQARNSGHQRRVSPTQ